MADTKPEPIDDFVALSAILTGIAADKLRPQFDTHGTAAAYLAYATKHGGADFAHLMAVHAAHRDEGPETIADAVLNRSGPVVADAARTVILMWYLGAWYPPAGLAAYRRNPSVPAPFVVVSSDAYTQGWAWRVGQAHPMGYSDLRFGYWQDQPQALSDLVGA
jgi:hypothetical protein